LFCLGPGGEDSSFSSLGDGIVFHGQEYRLE
jgi:hypothetical protein